MDRRADERDRAALLADLFGQQLPTGAGERLLRTSDVAMLFQVSERTVSEWARRGRVPSVRTPGGHRRYPADQISRLFVDGRHGTADTPRPATPSAASPLASYPLGSYPLGS